MSDLENETGKEPEKKPNFRALYRTNPLERYSYVLYFVGQNIFYMLVLTFMSPYFTDIGINAALAATVTLIIRVWDAVNDPIFGGIVDRTRFKRGKFLPWIWISTIIIPVSTIFLFGANNNMSLAAKVAWVIGGYMLWDIGYTICDVPIFGILTVMTDQQAEKTSLTTGGQVASMVAMFGVSVFIPAFRERLGGWLPSVVIVSLFAFVTMIPVCFTAKERMKPPMGDQEIKLKAMLEFVRKNKFMLLFLASNVVNSIFAVSTNLGMYLARYNLGGEEMQSYMYIVAFVPIMAISPFIPMISRKIDKYYLFMISVLGGAFLGIVQYFLGYENFTLFLVISFFRGVLAAFPAIINFLFTLDITEYGIWKSGVRAVGISFSVQSFTSKITAAISTTMGLFALSLIGFIEGEGAVQVAGFPDKLWFIFTLVPAIGGLLQGVMLFWYKLRDKDVAIMIKANLGQISREESEELLAGKY